MLRSTVAYPLRHRLRLRTRADALILALFSIAQVLGTLWIAIYQPFDARGLDGRAILLLIFYGALFVVSMNRLFANALDREARD